MTTRYGTSHFATLPDAHHYYAPMGFSRDDVKAKIENEEIHIGLPIVPAGMRIVLDASEGRYWIEDAPAPAAATSDRTHALADQFRWAVPNDSEGATGRDGDARVRAWCEVNNARCDGDAFGMAFSDLKGAQPSYEIAAMRGDLFNRIMVETCDLHGLWQEPSKAEVYALAEVEDGFGEAVEGAIARAQGSPDAWVDHHHLARVRS